MDVRGKTTPRIRGTTPEIEKAARLHRREMTPAERKLWESLKGHQLDGLKFRRQHPVGSFVLDFYCPSRKLAVELDGGVHEEQEDHDDARTEKLGEYGYRVIRFRNEEVFDDLDSVLARILAAANEGNAPP
jgi:very-short-patch-repair endonuclease